VKKKLNLKLLPNAWFTRWHSGFNMSDRQHKSWMYDINEKYKKASGNDYLYMGEFHPDIKLIHFTHAQNKPPHSNQVFV
jgi:hypothetical protein